MLDELMIPHIIYHDNNNTIHLAGQHIRAFHMNEIVRKPILKM